MTAPPPPPPETSSSQFTVQSGGGVGGRRNSASSLPASQPPTSTAATFAPPTQVTNTQPSGAAAVEKTREAFLESLRETPELYSLTRPELENLVSVVVREPGFPKLVRCIFHFFFFHLRPRVPSPGGRGCLENFHAENS
jgi:hypothetical protein